MQANPVWTGSGNQQVLDKIRKNMDLDDARYIIEQTIDAGIHVAGSSCSDIIAIQKGRWKTP